MRAFQRILMILLFFTCGALPAAADEPALIQSFTALPISGGFNPDYGGMNLDVVVLSGENPCKSDASMVRLHVHNDEDATVVEAFRSIVADSVCPSLYAPVYGNYRAELHFDKRQIHRIVLKHFQQWGADYTIPVL